MTLSMLQCMKRLNDLITNKDKYDGSQTVSEVAKSAWGDEKDSCVDKMNGYTKIEKFINDSLDKKESSHGSAKTSSVDSSNSTTDSKTTSISGNTNKSETVSDKSINVKLNSQDSGTDSNTGVYDESYNASLSDSGVSMNTCKKQMYDKVMNDPNLTKLSTSGISSAVWGSGSLKEQCITKMGGYVNIGKFVKTIPYDETKIISDTSSVQDPSIQNVDGHGAANDLTGTESQSGSVAGSTAGSIAGIKSTDYYEITEKTADNKIAIDENVEKTVQSTKTQTTSTTDSMDAILSQGLSSLKVIGWIILGLILVITISKCIKYLFTFIYDVMNAKRYIFLKVIVPRGDSKSDREREKEIAKDMKEKMGRMSQVLRNMHKLGERDVWDNVMRWFFSKAKFTLAMQYENGLISFIIGTYPEYIKTIESAIAAQYSEASIETIKTPQYFQKKYDEVIPLETTKAHHYPIRIFKQLEDDPLNNLLDAIGKIQVDDTFTILMTMRPEGEHFNKMAQGYADALYKKDKAFLNRNAWWKYIIMPWKLLDFLISGPSQGLVETFSPNAKQGDPMIRMVKAEEEALNIMGEEAGKPAFYAGLLLISSSDHKDRAKENIRNVVSAFTVYKDEYNNSLDQPEVKADMFGAIFKPLWKFCASFNMPAFFFRHGIFTINEITSIYHFPDGVYNRSPIIKWMDYKVLPCPDNIPVLTQENGFYMTGMVAEDYLKGDVSKIFDGMKHRSVGTKMEKKETLKPINEATDAEKTANEIIEKDGQEFVKIITQEQKTGLKLFKDGALLGINVYRNRFTPIYMKRKDRSRHHYIIGKSGGGKSVYISALARQDVWNGDGLAVIDPHGDLVEDILEYIPKERAKDIVYFDAGNEDRPMGLNIFEIDNKDQADRVVNDVTEIFLKMFGSEIFGPRIQEYFKYGALTLLEDMEDGATLIDVPRIFTDEVFREYKVKKVTNPVVRNFWEKTYNAMGDREKQEIIPYFTSKFVSFITNRLIRNIIGQTKSAFKFREAMDSGKILLINLSKGKIGELNAQLLGMILVTQIYNAAMSRANIPEADRRDFFLYVDEFQNFVTGTFADILSEARKYHLSLIMAHQYIAQLDSGKQEGGKSNVKDAVFGNVGTMQSFKIGAPDAEFFEKEYAPVLSPQDIIGISNFKVYIKLNINNATSRVFSMDTIWTQDYQNKKTAEILKEYSSKKYGRKREYVDAEIAARLGMAEEFGTEDTSSQQPVSQPEQSPAQTVSQDQAVTESQQVEQQAA